MNKHQDKTSLDAGDGDFFSFLFSKWQISQKEEKKTFLWHGDMLHNFSVHFLCQHRILNLLDHYQADIMWCDFATILHNAIHLHRARVKSQVVLGEYNSWYLFYFV